jgi:hypothetical protein
MTGFLTEDEIAQLTPSELVPHRTPIPRISYPATNITGPAKPPAAK